MEFEYLLNSACSGNREWTKRGRKKLRKLLDSIADMGSDRVVVASLYIAQILRKSYPSLKISVSCFANVNSLPKALYWEDLGADTITLSPVECNRDFKLIRRMSERLSATIQLIANNNCLNHCPLYFTHNNFVSHASSRSSFHSGFDYCRIFCRKIISENPEKALSATWIRPEDVKLYEDAGVGSIKLVDRIMSTDAIVRIVTAYSGRSYTGNLYDLFTDNSLNAGHRDLGIIHKFRYFFHPSRVNIRKLYRLLKNREGLSGSEYYIDNSKLDGFITHFIENNCRDLDCEACGWCAEWASRALSSLEKAGETSRKNSSFLDEIISGRIFK